MVVAVVVVAVVVVAAAAAADDKVMAEIVFGNTHVVGCRNSLFEEGSEVGIAAAAAVPVAVEAHMVYLDNEEAVMAMVAACMLGHGNLRSCGYHSDVALAAVGNCANLGPARTL